MTLFHHSQPIQQKSINYLNIKDLTKTVKIDKMK